MNDAGSCVFFLFITVCNDKHFCNFVFCIVAYMILFLKKPFRFFFLNVFANFFGDTNL